MFNSLRSVSPQQILKNTDSIVAQDRKLTLRLLEHLHEIDRRKLYLERGFASTFDYCTKHLRLSEPSAARRLRTARCVARYPQLYSLLESGELNVTVVSMVSKHIKPGNVDEVISRTKGKSKREVERIIAEYEPRTAVPADRARVMIVPIARRVVSAALPASAASSQQPGVSMTPKSSSTVAIESLAKIEPRITGASAVATSPATVSRSTVISTHAATESARALGVEEHDPLLDPDPAAGSNSTVTGDSEKTPRSENANSVVTNAAEHQAVDLPAMKPDTETPQYQRLVRVEFTAHEALISKLEKVRSIISHRLPGNATLEQLIDFMASYVLEREDPAKRQERREARAAKQEEATVPASSVKPRHIPAQVRDQVYARDKQCTYVSPGGQRCGSTHVLQIDHIKPVARGGASTIDNLRVLCAYHNRLESERLMGKRGPDVVREATVAYRTCGHAAGFSPRDTTTAATRSPVTLSVVRHMSRKRSTPRISPRPSSGTPTIPRIIATTGIEPAGTPAVPMPPNTQIETTMICCANVSGMS
jgi:5-methylcytosine-specific restriction endonuclease McrA